MSNFTRKGLVDRRKLPPLAWSGAVVGGICTIGALVLFLASIWGTAALANDRYANATGKDCTSCHQDVDQNAYMLTRYGAAFRRNGCPNVPGGC